MVKDFDNTYVEVEMYSLDSYVEKFVKSKGPINVLAIDTEGWDFDVLFGASSVLDRTYYLEFEYHEMGMSFMFFPAHIGILCNQHFFPTCTPDIHNLSR